ncbi:heavy metal translocating P-type ATPase [Rivibacter subsaxonicus]|uniref:Cu2+-exporting ATPase n=1 Tax=Rivibacter subsaxonicus TaxID=457575 RepID=A0A4Q7VNM1_9BURK|nr:cation-translocating P-type ATPase [Rivibacter subsaxonicus]RZT97971.1 Cu2+-exporting ATPase [Rivibacter subsaxonicus]
MSAAISSPISPVQPTPASLALDARAATALDDDLALAECTEWRERADGTREAQTLFALGGLHCAACAGIIEAALRQEPGVGAVQVNAARERALVRWDPQRTGAAALIEAVRRAGYSAHPAHAEAVLEAQRRAERDALWRLFVAAFCMMQVMMVAAPSYLATRAEIGAEFDQLLRWAGWVMSLPVLMFSATPFFSGAWRALRAGRIGMDLPVALAIVITFVASTGATFAPGGAFGDDVWFDSLTMFVTFLLAGRWLEQRLRGRSRRALDVLLRRLPDSVERESDDGRFSLVPVLRLRVGDRVRVAAGQLVPGDGVVLEGESALDEALLSGESRPVERRVGDAVVAGSLNLAAPLLMRVERLGADTRQQQIADLVDRAGLARPPTLRLADRIAGPFMAVVLLLALAAFIGWQRIDPTQALAVAVAVLVVSCPCALAIAAPTGLLAAATELARRGVLVQRLDAIETLAAIDVAAFDKTGTLSDERLALARVVPEQGAPLAAAAALARQSRHPLAQALAASVDADATAWTELREQPGAGLEAADAQGRRWRLGSASFVGADDDSDPGRPALYFAAVTPGATGSAWRFEFDEVPRAGADALVAALRADGVRVQVLSGDRAGAVEVLARRVGADAWQASATPQDKRLAVEREQAEGRRVLVVGDGLNDAPVVAQADVSIALGHGAALTQLRADLVVLGSRLPEIAAARRLARRTRQLMRQNLAWAVIYNLLALPLALAGLLAPWAAGLGMALSSLLVVGNSLRLLSSPRMDSDRTPATTSG